MKVTQPTNAPPPNAPNKSANKSQANDESRAAASTGRDFASVLDEVAQPRQRTSNRSADDNDKSEDYGENKASERTEREREARRREDRRDSEGNSGFDTRGHVRQTELRAEAHNAHAVLHIADLERIVSAVRTQITAQGHREVMIELRRSVLEGLRVKLSADEAGRVTAEFIASSERVKAQIDARAAELSELLRSRGINLAALKTSVGADASDAGHTREQTGALAGADAITNRAAANVSADSAREEDGGLSETGKTYRA